MKDIGDKLSQVSRDLLNRKVELEHELMELKHCLNDQSVVQQSPAAEIIRIRINNMLIDFNEYFDNIEDYARLLDTMSNHENR